ncbi:putative dehydrogenase [Frondihabitans sp. PhB188]|uniref:Gfo/Idh/MocA family protein n=1 Tax=Frondihabitans sp. PhB188 TaxID=2485200 RepID=UPI000F499A11|nr:Gfo/Idh/MocA family oxidoreductase [Frondihabitans sp. PhB188]ROQ36597.1 putative dehydrogenase [Frondihabitans sp. PhB188]
MADSLGVAVIGAGMAGKAHAAAYRSASTLYESTLPPIRLVSIGDVSEKFGSLAAERFGFERNDTSWQAIAADPSIDVVSVVIANSLHREVVEGLLAAGKHVLCEKPLSDTLGDARAMADAARAASTVARIGFTYRRSPAIAYIRDLVQNGTLGTILHFSGRYWTDYAADPRVPLSWRFKGPQGSGALADVGSHLSYIAEFLAGPIRSVNGGRFATVIKERPEPLGQISGRGAAAVSDTLGAVENDDYATFSAAFDEGVGSFEVSRVATGNANTLEFEIFGDKGSARFDFRRPSEITLFLTDGPTAQRGFRQIILGPDHPYLAGGQAMDAQGVGHGQNDGFVFQARAFLEEVAGIPEADSLPRCASFDEGVHNMDLLQAVADSALVSGASVAVADDEKVSA